MALGTKLSRNEMTLNTILTYARCLCEFVFFVGPRHINNEAGDWSEV